MMMGSRKYITLLTNVVQNYFYTFFNAGFIL